jgi:hypothetical protein
MLYLHNKDTHLKRDDVARTLKIIIEIPFWKFQASGKSKMQNIINSKCFVRQRSAIQAATSCVCHRFASNVSSDGLTSDPISSAKEKPPKKVTPLKAPRKKRKYDIKRVLDDFNSLNVQALETSEKAGTQEISLESQPRRNEVNIEMLPRALYEKIFGNDKKTEVLSSNLKLAQDHLRQHELLDKVEPPLPDIDLPLPKLQVKLAVS